MDELAKRPAGWLPRGQQCRSQDHMQPLVVIGSLRVSWREAAVGWARFVDGSLLCSCGVMLLPAYKEFSCHQGQTEPQ